MRISAALPGPGPGGSIFSADLHGNPPVQYTAPVKKALSWNPFQDLQDC